MPDQPIAHTADGRPLFDNTPTVVCVLVTDPQGNVFVVRRANNPGQGLLGLPGGYHMRGESWQEAGAREVAEEIGLKLYPEQLRLVSMETDEYGNNLVIALYPHAMTAEPVAVDGEALEVVRFGMNKLVDPAYEWAFPRHRAVVSRYIGERYKAKHVLSRQFSH